MNTDKVRIVSTQATRAAVEFRLNEDDKRRVRHSAIGALTNGRSAGYAIAQGYRLASQLSKQSADCVEEVKDHEAAVIEEARAIIAGRSSAFPTAEHLRVLLKWTVG